LEKARDDVGSVPYRKYVLPDFRTSVGHYDPYREEIVINNYAKRSPEQITSSVVHELGHRSKAVSAEHLKNLNRDDLLV
jgi:hypothetical protein